MNPAKFTLFYSYCWPTLYNKGILSWSMVLNCETGVLITCMTQLLSLKPFQEYFRSLIGLCKPMYDLQGKKHMLYLSHITDCLCQIFVFYTNTLVNISDHILARSIIQVQYTNNLVRHGIALATLCPL